MEQPHSQIRSFTGDEDFTAAIQQLAAKYPYFDRIIDLCGMPKLQRRDAGFAALLQIMTTQQLSVAAADRIWQRLCDCGADNPETLSKLDNDTLRLCGLSAGKITYARALLAANLDHQALLQLDDTALRQTLLAIKGIGPWSVDIYLLFCLARADAFAPGDLAIQEAARHLLDLPQRPDARQLTAIAEPWKPWRGAAARLLWHYYRHIKGRSGISD